MSEKLYVLGHPVSHSKSPVMYNAVYEKAGLPWHYGLMDVPTAPEAEAFLAARDFLSINITTPYKPEAFAAADVRAASATLAHGANVLVNKDGALIAYNTDGQGCVAYLERAGVDFRGTSVVVCGTGPTSLSILHAVAQEGVLHAHVGQRRGRMRWSSSAATRPRPATSCAPTPTSWGRWSDGWWTCPPSKKGT